MRKTSALILALGLLVFAACSSYTSNPEMDYYHGANVPEGYITVVRASTTEIEFQVRVEFPQRQLYHLVLEDNAPVAEGWYPTIQGGLPRAYTVTLKPKKGLAFEIGKTYRLCIGEKNPEEVQLHSSSYHCIADFVFVMQEKS